MEILNKKKTTFLKIIRVYSCILLFIAIVYFYAAYADLEILSRGNDFLKNSVSNLSVSDLVFNGIFFILVALYCLIVGVGLFKSKYWAFYTAIIGGLLIFLFSIITSNLAIIGMIMMIFSFYILLNRSHFKKK